MDPSSLGPGRVHAAFELAGVAAAVVLFLLEARRRRRLDERLLGVMVTALFCGALASRLGPALRYWLEASDPNWAGTLMLAGQSVLGGLAGAYAGALLGKRLFGVPESTGDVFAPAVALGIGIGRFGCLLAEIPGRPTGGGWGVTVDVERARAIAGFPAEWIERPLHPSFAYEIAFHLLAFAALLRLRDRPRFSGQLFKHYVTAYAVFRFAVEWTRANPVAWLGLTRSQLFLIPALAVLAAWWLRRPPARERSSLEEATHA